MKNEQVTHTPQGLADVLWEEAELKFHIETVARSIFKQNGYKMVETPTFEYFDVFRKEIGSTSIRDLYKFFDKDGNTLVLRPDITPSIARASATVIPASPSTSAFLRTESARVIFPTEC